MLVRRGRGDTWHADSALRSPGYLSRVRALVYRHEAPARRCVRDRRCSAASRSRCRCSASCVGGQPRDRDRACCRRGGRGRAARRDRRDRARRDRAAPPLRARHRARALDRQRATGRSHRSAVGGRAARAPRARRARRRRQLVDALVVATEQRLERDRAARRCSPASELSRARALGARRGRANLVLVVGAARRSSAAAGDSWCSRRARRSTAPSCRPCRWSAISTRR